MDRLNFAVVCEVYSLQWQRLQGLLRTRRRDGLTPPPPPWRWLLEEVLLLALPFQVQHVLTASSLHYITRIPGMTNLSTVSFIRLYEPGLIARLLGVVLFFFWPLTLAV